MSTKSFANVKSSVVGQLRLTLFILLAFAGFNVFTIYRQIDSMTSDGHTVNYAGVVRGRTQRLIKLAFYTKTSTSADPEVAKAQQEIEASIKALDGVVAGLINGSSELDLEKIDDPAFQAKMQEVQQSWTQLKTILQNYRNAPTAQTKTQLLQASETYWTLANETVSAAEEYARGNVDSSKRLAVILFCLNLVILGVIWWISQNIQIKLKSTIGNLSSSSSEIAATVSEHERVVAQQAASVNETTTTMDELEASCRQSAAQAQTAVSVAQQVLALAEEGSQSVVETLEGMFAMEKRVESIAEQIVKLSEQANQISSISLLVSELANQTKMIALNSSVEAVRAGEAGKGFAVVANEIRKLSDQSQQSAERINALVAEIQKAVNSTVMVTDEGTKTVKLSVKRAQHMEHAFSGVTEAVKKVVLNNQQVSLNLRQQVDAIQEVVKAMDVINKGAQETATGLAQTKQGTMILNNAASTLQEMM